MPLCAILGSGGTYGSADRNERHRYEARLFKLWTQGVFNLPLVDLSK
jgi:hypothetical protein